MLAYFDGKSIIPPDFTVHTEKELERKKAKTQYKKAVDPKSNGGKRRKEAHPSKIDQSLAMIKRAVKKGYFVNYVLSDAWFTSHVFIKTIRVVKGGTMHVIAGIRNDKRKYAYDGQLFNAKEIISQLKTAGSEHRCRKWNIRYHEAIVHYEGLGSVKLFMCRYPRQRKWRVFITTNTNLSFVEMMKIYGIRWTIEVLFRETKQHLQLGGCQSQDFGAQIASNIISLILFMFLAYLKRMDSYETIGELYRLVQYDVCEKNLAERLWMLFEELLTFMIDGILAQGSLDISLLKQSEEYRYVKDVFASSFLFEQMDSVNKSA